MIVSNGGKADLQYWYSQLPPVSRQLVSRAHGVIFRHVQGKPPPYLLAGYETCDGLIHDDPEPNGEYVGNLAGSWIWSCPQAHFRFRAVMSKRKLEIWAIGAESAPAGLILPTLQPIGVIAQPRGQ